MEVEQLIAEVDKRVLTAIEKNKSLKDLPIEDWSLFAPGFIQRNYRQNVEKKAEPVLIEFLHDKIVQNIWAFDWMIPWSFEAFEKERAHKNMDFLNALFRLKIDVILFLKSWTQKSLVKKSYYEDYRIREACSWDIEWANDAAKNVSGLIQMCQGFQGVEPQSDRFTSLRQSVLEKLPILQEFSDFLPEFCSVLDQSGFLDLTDKVVEEEEATLDFALPSLKCASEKAGFKPLAKTVNKSVADFQGFVIGIVLEPGSPDNRDLHDQWISKEEIFKAAMFWSLNSQKVGIQHEEWPEEQGVNHPDFVCVFNWIQYGDTVIGGQTVKDGTWLQAYQAMNDDAKAKLQNYELNGLSPGGMATVWKDKEV